VENLLLLEGAAVQSMICLGIFSAKSRESYRKRKSRGMVLLRTLPEKIRKKLTPMLRRVAGRMHHWYLADVVLLYATNSLQQTLMRESGIEASFHIELPDGMQTFSGYFE
jgi:hypothetical protein